MNDARAVRLVESFRDLRAILENVGNRHWTALDPVGERLTLEQLHHQVGIADVVQRTDIRMIELRDDARLALETELQLLVLREFGRQHFNGNAAIETDVAAAPHLSHAARADRSDYFVRPQPRPGADGSHGKRELSHLWERHDLPRDRRGLASRCHCDRG